MWGLLVSDCFWIEWNSLLVIPHSIFLDTFWFGFIWTCSEYSCFLPLLSFTQKLTSKWHSKLAAGFCWRYFFRWDKSRRWWLIYHFLAWHEELVIHTMWNSLKTHHRNNFPSKHSLSGSTAISFNTVSRFWNNFSCHRSIHTIGTINWYKEKSYL